MTPVRAKGSLARSNPKLIKFRLACQQLGLTLSAGFVAVATGSFPIEVIKGDGGWKCRQADIDRIRNGPATHA